MGMIDVFHITKDYSGGRGIFDLSFQVEEGEVFGFLGPNGAGKTTTIRQLMGFVRSDMGECFIGGKNCWDDAVEIQRRVGYLPGELALPDNMTGGEFIRFYAQMREQKSMRRAEKLIERFELDTTVKIRRMSRGTKQKVGIVCAFMHNPRVLILDEPTSGLDPLMQSRFVDLLLEEKDVGKTVFLSSHIFDEIEKTCDRIAIIREGRLAATEDVAAVRSRRKKTFLLTFETRAMAESFRKEPYEVRGITGSTATVTVEGNLQGFLKSLEQYQVTNIDVRTESLEEIFMHYYGGAGHD